MTIAAAAAKLEAYASSNQVPYIDGVPCKRSVLHFFNDNDLGIAKARLMRAGRIKQYDWAKLEPAYLKLGEIFAKSGRVPSIPRWFRKNYSSTTPQKRSKKRPHRVFCFDESKIIGWLALVAYYHLIVTLLKAKFTRSLKCPKAHLMKKNSTPPTTVTYHIPMYNYLSSYISFRCHDCYWWSPSIKDGKPFRDPRYPMDTRGRSKWYCLPNCMELQMLQSWVWSRRRGTIFQVGGRKNPNLTFIEE